MIVSLIVAVDNNFGIGLNNDMPWGRIKEDLKFFKSKTENSTVIMGRLTFESINSKPLINRENIVITKDRSLIKEYKEEKTSLLSFNSLEDALTYSLLKKNNEVFIIGGAQIYKQAIEYADIIYITHLSENYSCDKFFPKFDYELFEREKIHSFIHDNKNIEVFKYTRRV